MIRGRRTNSQNSEIRLAFRIGAWWCVAHYFKRMGARVGGGL